ncbi:MAG: excinuclease ABC subunit UvrA [Eubacteriales bacterium]|nr:excinuclease ABC subunit UvrA [Eubacteriales bacterium]
MHTEIIIKGARENNLKNINLTIPRDKLVVLTGVSGSGKSSLAFDTIYAEGQRRYVESLSSYARQFLGQMEKPEVDYIEGLSPAISIDQKTTNNNPRSTVGTVTEIYDYFRLLWARIGVPHCPKCGKEIKKQTIDQIVDQICTLPERSKIQILAPVVRGKKGEHVKVIENAKKSGYVRIRIDGNIIEISEEIKLEKNKKHNIEIVVDRLVIKEDIKKRLTDSIENAMALTDGIIIVDIDGKEDVTFSQNFACEDCNISIEEIEPRSFSFNNPRGACSECTGLGVKMIFDPEIIVPNPELSLKQGAIVASGWNAISSENSMSASVVKSLSEKYKFSLDTPYKDLPEKIKDILMYGTKGEKIDVSWEGTNGLKTYSYAFEGIVNNLERRYKDVGSEVMKQELEQYMTNITCKACKGNRLRPEILAVTVNNKNISEITALSIKDAKIFFDNLTLSEREKIIGEQILKEINARIGFLVDVGLDYLSLSRTAGTLSGGESQRIRLATQIGSGLVGVLYILDEPSIGLHQRDNDKLLKTLNHLRDIGNTLIVVEHDEDTMCQADYIVDIGPKAGSNGGEVVFSGTYEEILKAENSLTGAYLSRRLEIPIPKERRKPTKNKISIKGAFENNLKKVNVDIPLGLFVCVTGVSGSGKSSLINEVLYKTLAKELNKAKCKTGKMKSIKGLENLDKVINIDQSPIGRTPRSNPATYTGLFDLIRDLFANTPEAKMRGFQKGRFSFNVKGGRCEACSGDGIIKIEMHFLPDVYVPCEVCNGKRYNRETLEVKYKGKTISDVLDMTIEEALVFFENLPRIKEKLQVISDVGLSYIKLGQSSTTLSGGEAQRIKLATELSKRATGKTIYVLDEPTTGLHTYDVHKLTEIIQKLVNTGNSVIVIEHNLDVIKTADYIIDLGPEGGDGGGQIIATGTPEDVANTKGSYTGKYLKSILERK